MDLADFLLARIAEDELDAPDVHELDCDLVRNGPVDPGFGWTCSCGHPACVLVECDAKRRIVVRCQEMQTAAVPMAVHLAQQTLADLALPYADHPDYDEAWRP